MSKISLFNPIKRLIFAAAALTAALVFTLAGCDLPDPFFVEVTAIEDVPAAGTAGTPLTLTAAVRPRFANNSGIVWLVIDAGTTGASVSGNVLNTDTNGTVIIRAVIANGGKGGKDYTQDFTIVFSGGLTAYNVHFETDGGGDIADQRVIEGETAARPAVPFKSGFVFENWYSDAELTALYDFSTPVTADTTLYAKWLAIAGISIKTQPSKLIYAHGDTLDLSGLAVTLEYDGGATEDVEYSQFASKSITADPAHGTELSLSTHHDTAVLISAGDYSAATNKLTVTKAAGAAVGTPSASWDFASKTITVSAVTAPANGQSVEYAFSTSDAADPADLAWVGKLTFTGADDSIADDTTYYIYARSASNENYSAGAASISEGITTSSTPVPVSGVTLNKAGASLTVGAAETLIATVAPSNAANKIVTWQSSDPAAATVSGGLVTAVSAGTATITVTTADGGFKAACLVTVTAATVPVTGVTLNKSGTNLTVGEQETLTATVLPLNATNKAVTWSSNNAQGAAVSADGTVTAAAPGDMIITVTTEDGGFTATCTVTVTAAVTPQARITSTGVEYATLTEAITAAANGTSAAPTEIVILKDITVSSGYTIPAIKNIKLTVPAGQEITITAAAGSFRLFSVSNASTSLTLGPTTGGGTLTLSGNNQAAASERMGVYVSYVSGNVTTFVLNDGVTITGFNRSGLDGHGGGVYLSSGTFTMNGGKIIGNRATASSGASSSAGSGGGVYLRSGTFTMSGGEISGNTASSLGDGGGGVYAYSGTFTMNDGTISGNTALSGGGVYLYGGTFTMNGGTISGNTASSVVGDGGGVYVYTNGTFNVGKTAVVSGNQKKSDSTPNNVYLSSTSVITLGTNANAPAQGMAIHVQTKRADGVIVSSGATAAMTGYFVPDEAGKTMTHLSGQLFIGIPATGVTLNKTTASIAVGAQETLTAAVAPPNAINKTVTWSTSDAAIATVSGGTVTAESAGTATITATADGGFTATCAVTVTTPEARIGATEYPTLTAAITAAVNGTLTDPTEIVILKDITASAVTTGNYSYAYRIPTNKNIKLTVPDGQDITITAAAGEFSLFYVSNASSSLTLGPTAGGGKLTLSGGNHAAVDSRSGVYVSGSGRTFVLNDGVTITDFKINNGEPCSSVCISSESTFTMNGGTISGNTASSGGGVYVSFSSFTMNSGTISDNTGGGVYVGRGTFTMNGGTISGNTASYSGGGVSISSESTFNMIGGTIQGNTATTEGGGVFVYDSTFTMSGGTISDNTASDGGGVYVYANWTSENPVIFTMSGGTIQGNTAASQGGGVYVIGYYSSFSTFTMSGGTIYGTDNAAKTNTANEGVAVYLGSNATAKYGDGDDIITGADTGIDTTVTGHN